MEQKEFMTHHEFVKLIEQAEDVIEAALTIGRASVRMQMTADQVYSAMNAPLECLAAHLFEIWRNQTNND